MNNQLKYILLRNTHNSQYYNPLSSELKTLHFRFITYNSLQLVTPQTSNRQGVEDVHHVLLPIFYRCRRWTSSPFTFVEADSPLLYPATCLY